MVWTYAQIVAEFDAVVGSGVAGLVTDALKVGWFNEGQSRLNPRYESQGTLTWSAGTKSIALATDFVQMDRILYDQGVTPQSWVVWGKYLKHVDQDEGATEAGTAVYFYWAEWPDVTSGGE